MPVTALFRTLYRINTRRGTIARLKGVEMKNDQVFEPEPVETISGPEVTIPFNQNGMCRFCLFPSQSPDELLNHYVSVHGYPVTTVYFYKGVKYAELDKQHRRSERAEKLSNPLCPIHHVEMKDTPPWTLNKIILYCPKNDCKTRYVAGEGYTTTDKLPSEEIGRAIGRS
jgi:hypothetical protein